MKILDVRNMRTKEEREDYLKQELNFPDWYGKNLDALYDMLTSYEGSILIKHSDLLKNNRIEQGTILYRLLQDAQEENEELILYFL